MAKKSISKALALGAIAAEGMASVSAPTVENIAEANVTTVQQAQQQQNARAQQGQQANKVAQDKAQSSYMDYKYLPFGEYGYMGNPSISPKEYGLYLLRIGKNKYNDRKRKHYAKALA